MTPLITLRASVLPLVTIPVTTARILGARSAEMVVWVWIDLVGLSLSELNARNRHRHEASG